MSGGEYVVSLIARVTGEHFGLWCDACLLPSLVETCVSVESASGSQFGAFIVRSCEGCGVLEHVPT